MHFGSWIGGALAGAVLFGAVAADAKSCQELVVEKSYRCTTVHQGVDGTSELCALFLPARGGGVRLLVDGLEMMPCACEHTGSITRPRFGASAEFACAGHNRVITGKATKTKLDKVFSRGTRDANAFAAVCVLDDTCSIRD